MYKLGWIILSMSRYNYTLNDMDDKVIVDFLVRKPHLHKGVLSH